MQKIRSFFARLTGKKNKQPIDAPGPSGWKPKKTKKKQAAKAPQNDASKGRLRWTHHRPVSQGHRRNRSRVQSAVDLERGNDAICCGHGIDAPLDGAHGARRAPVLSNGQTPRSPRPPFEESVRTLTRRTPGSEDATSIGNEIGYPVVGPATIRPGLGLSGTVFHQDIITYSHDVYTNTPPSESYSVANNPLIQSYNDTANPQEDSPVESNTPMVDGSDPTRVSTESQTIPRISSVPLLLLPQLPMVSHHESVPGFSLAEEHDRLHRAPKEHIDIPPANQEETEPAPDQNALSSAFHPITSEAQEPSSMNETHNTGSERPQTNVHYPSQIRRNRSNTGHNNTPSRRVPSVCDQAFESIEGRFSPCGKLMRAKLIPSAKSMNNVPCRELSVGCFLSKSSQNQPARESPSEKPLEIMIHSLQCSGNSECFHRLEDASEKNPSPAPSNVVCSFSTAADLLQIASYDAALAPESKMESEHLPPEVTTNVSWSDLRNNLTVTNFEYAEKNPRVHFSPRQHNSTGFDDPTSHDDIANTSIGTGQTFCQDILRRQYPANFSEEATSADPINDTDAGAFSVTSYSGKFSRRDAVSDLQMTPPQLASLSEVQAITSGPSMSPQRTQHGLRTQTVDCSTQSVLVGLTSRTKFSTSRPSSPFATPYNQLDATAEPWRYPSDYDFKSYHAGFDSDDDVCRCTNQCQGAQQMRTPKKHSTLQLVQRVMVNQACGPDVPVLFPRDDFTLPSNIPFGNDARTENIPSYQHETNGLDYQCCYLEPEAMQVCQSTTTDDKVINPVDTCAGFPTGPTLSKPLLVVSMSDEEISTNPGGMLEDEGSPKSIDMQNRLFVRQRSGTSLASSVYIGSDGKPAIINKGRASPHLSSPSVSQSRQAPADCPCFSATGAIPKRETGAKPKIGVRGEPLGVRKRTLPINDDSPTSRDRSSVIDENPYLGARGHRVINDRNRGRVRNQLTSRKYHFGVKTEPHRSPGKWTRRVDSVEGKRRSPDNRCTRRSYVEQTGDELKSIWINPETERSCPSSNSTIDINVESSQTMIVSDVKSPSSALSRRSCRTPQSASIAKSPKPSAGHDATPPQSPEAEPLIFLFECVVCKDYFKLPTRQCDEGHGVCDKCLGQEDSCPICNTFMHPEPNKVIDSLMRTTPFSSKNSGAGFREINWMENCHQPESRYRLRGCPFANRSKVNCPWRGVRSAIRGHMKRVHGYLGSTHTFKVFFPVEAFKSRHWMDEPYNVEVLFVENEIFELHRVFDARKLCVWGLLRHILARDVSKFCYIIRFQPYNMRVSMSFNVEAVSGSEVLDEAFRRGKRFKFYLDSFTDEPLDLFSVQLKVVPKSNTTFHSIQT